MNTETLIELNKKTLQVMNIRNYLEDYNKSVGISKEDLEKSLSLAEITLEHLLTKISPSAEVHDSVVFASDGSNNPISVDTHNMSEEYLSVPYYEDGRRVNVRVSIMEI